MFSSKKGITLTLTEILYIGLFAIFLVVLIPGTKNLYAAIFPAENIDKQMENAMDRLVIEIDSLKKDQSTILPFDVDLSIDHFLTAINICQEGEHPSTHPCSPGRSTLCLQKGDGRRLCKGIDNFRFKATSGGEFLYPVESRSLSIRRTSSSEEIGLLTFEFVTD